MCVLLFQRWLAPLLMWLSPLAPSTLWYALVAQLLFPSKPLLVRLGSRVLLSCLLLQFGLTRHSFLLDLSDPELLLLVFTLCAVRESACWSHQFVWGFVLQLTLALALPPSFLLVWAQTVCGLVQLRRLTAP